MRETARHGNASGAAHTKGKRAHDELFDVCQKRMARDAFSTNSKNQAMI